MLAVWPSLASMHWATDRSMHVAAAASEVHAPDLYFYSRWLWKYWTQWISKSASQIAFSAGQQLRTTFFTQYKFPDIKSCGLFNFFLRYVAIICVQEHQAAILESHSRACLMHSPCNRCYSIMVCNIEVVIRLRSTINNRFSLQVLLSRYSKRFIINIKQ